MEEQEKRPIGGKRLAPEDRGSFWSNWGYLIVTAAVIVVLPLAPQSMTGAFS